MAANWEAFVKTLNAIILADVNHKLYFGREDTLEEHIILCLFEYIKTVSLIRNAGLFDAAESVDFVTENGLKLRNFWKDEKMKFNLIYANLFL